MKMVEAVVENNYQQLPLPHIRDNPVVWATQMTLVKWEKFADFANFADLQVRILALTKLIKLAESAIMVDFLEMRVTKD